MPSVRHGAQWASSLETIPSVVSPSPAPAPASTPALDPRSHPSRIRRRSRSSTAAALSIGLVAALLVSVAAWSTTVSAAGGYILMPRSELLARPVSGSAWANLKKVADGSLGTADACDINSDHHLRTLAAALVFARTGDAAYATKARAGVMAGMASQKDGCSQAVLSLGRQLAAYVLAADFAGLSGADETRFRTWLSAIRTKNIGGHSSRYTLSGTHNIAANNWGAWAGASRIAASLYLGDTADVAAAAKVTRGFLGERAQYAGFTDKLETADLSWSCSGSQSTYTPVNPACTKNGLNIDGGVVNDISRGGSLTWPPQTTGVQYQLESIQAVGLQVELLYRHGYPGAWGWSDSALRRMAGLVTRSDSAGGTGWNATTASRQMPWLLNKRYGTSIPTTAAGMGRGIGFTDWLYGNGGGGTAPKPTKKPTPKPTKKPTPKPIPAPPGGGSKPEVNTPSLRLARKATTPTAGVPALVSWSLAGSKSGLRRFELQYRVDGGAYKQLSLTSAGARNRWVTLTAGHEYTFRVRAVDKAGRVGAWKTIGPRTGQNVSDASASITWKGKWAAVKLKTYLRGAAHWTKSKGATATLRFKGTSVALVGPIGSTRGKARVYLDGKLVKTIDLRAAKFHPRRVVFAANVKNGPHTLVIKALGTSGRPTVAIDAIYVVAPS